MAGRSYNFFIKFSLLFCSVIMAITFCEIILRVVKPQYKYVAEAQLQPDRFRIRKNLSGVKSYRHHPDLKKRHRVIHNSLGFRQHREFSKEKPQGVIRIGFFGDSYTENLRMESQYSFTEPLDYLLNKAGAKFEVMNFGVDGYGTDQVYFHYLQEGAPLGLDYVFYLSFSNDLSDIMLNNLLRIDRYRNLNIKQYRIRPFVNLINKFYITYFLLEHNTSFRRLFTLGNKKTRLKIQHEMARREAQYKSVTEDFRTGVITPEVKEASDIFLAVLLEMRRACNQNGAKFYIVTLPFLREQALYNFLTERGFEVINLLDEFKEIYRDDGVYRFKSDGHWDEEGNKLAALFLFRFLAEELSISYSGDEFIEHALYEYYSSFEPYKVTNYSVRKHSDFPSALNEGIIAKYLELEDSM